MQNIQQSMKQIQHTDILQSKWSYLTNSQKSVKTFFWGEVKYVKWINKPNLMSKNITDDEHFN